MSKGNFFFVTMLLCFVISFSQSKNSKTSEVVTGKNISVPIYNFDNFNRFLHPANDTAYVFNFWATWCGPCVKELPFFEELNKDFAGKKVKVILVSMDFRSKLKEQLIPFLETRQMKSQVIVLSQPNPNEWIDKVDSAWSGALPATLIVKGAKRQFFEKEFKKEELKELVGRFVN